MTVKVISEQEVLQEAAEVLLQHMAPAKVARFWAAWQVGGGNYLAIREQLFGGETMTTLYEKVQVYQSESILERMREITGQGENDGWGHG